MTAGPGNDRAAGRDRWLYVPPVLVLLHLITLAILHARPGIPGVLLWHGGPILLTMVAILAMGVGLWQAVRRRLTWTGPRAAGYLGLAMVLAMPLGYRTYPSSRDRRPSEVRFRVPLDGPVTVAWGGPTRDVNYHVVSPAERWAYDLLLTRQGRSYRTDGRTLDDYYAYGVPVLAPAAGTVRMVSDGEPENQSNTGFAVLGGCGNRIVLEVAPGEFLFLCHLQPGSTVVEPGARVATGQPLARVGNSGNSTEPHLHLHLQTTARAELGEGIPFYFSHYRTEGGVIPRGMPTGGARPQTIEHAEVTPPQRTP
jgi:hypothetical protein